MVVDNGMAEFRLWHGNVLLEELGRWIILRVVIDLTQQHHVGPHALQDLGDPLRLLRVARPQFGGELPRASAVHSDVVRGDPHGALLRRRGVGGKSHLTDKSRQDCDEISSEHAKPHA